MKLFVLGGTGGCGRHVVQEALARGHHVTAFGRSNTGLGTHPGLTFVQGDVRDVAALSAAMGGHDAVLSSLGPRDMGPHTIVQDGARSTLAAMQQTGVRRLLVVSVAMLFPGGVLTWIVRLVLRHALADSTAMESLVRASDTEWTLVRPPRLTDDPSRTYRSAVDKCPPPGFTVGRLAVALCMLDALEGRKHIREIVGISR